MERKGKAMPNEQHMTIHRAKALVLWAAKALAHSQRTGMPLGRLIHSMDEVEQAIELVGALNTLDNLGRE
jgi:hypothetical protein